MGSIERGPRGSIRRVMVVGDNRLSESIINGLTHEGFEVHLVAHSQSSTQSLDNVNVTVHKSNFSQPALESLFLEVKPDIVFSTQAAGSYEHQKATIDTAIATNVRRFVPAEWGQDALNGKIQERLPPVKERARVIDYLREQAAADKIEWVGIATGCSLEHAITSGNIGLDLEWQSATIHGSGNERFAASSTAWSGKVAGAVVEHWVEVKNRYLYASGMITSGNEIVELLQRQMGKKWESGCVDVEDIVHEAERRFERGFPDAGVFLMERSVLFDESVGAVRPFVEGDGRVVLGLEKERLDDVIGRVVHEYKHHGKGDCGCG